MTTKTAAKSALLKNGYEETWFAVYDARGVSSEWKYDNGIFVYTKAPERETFIVSPETTPDTLGLKGSADGKVKGQLCYVLQTTIYCNVDHSGAYCETSIKGTYTNFKNAKNMAMTCLLDKDVTKDSFVEFDEYSGQEDWAYGEDVMVQAVGAEGENYLIAVITKP